MAAALDPFFSGSVAGGLSMDAAFGGSSFGSGMHPRLQAMEEDDDNMPFAVDSLVVGTAHFATGSTTGATSVSGSSTMIMRDMIIQPPKRLQLLDNHNTRGMMNVIMGEVGEMGGGGGGAIEATNDIDSQLEEFKSFGASLMMASLQN